MPSREQEMRAEALKLRQPTDRAVYTLPISDTPNGMDGWTLFAEADPLTRGRAINDFHEGSLVVRVIQSGLLVINRPDEVELDRTMEG